jgi:DNA processing protein
MNTISPPYLLKHTPDHPKKLYLKGSSPDENLVCITIVGSRNNTNYGKQVCEEIVQALRGYRVVIVSGLASGIDTYTHRCALKHGIPTIAVLGSGSSPEIIYPQANKNLASEIIEHGGCLLSEYPDHHRAQPWNFPERNRIMAGMSHAVIVIEAELPSGSMMTAHMALEYNRDALVVPGSIFSPQSRGTNSLIKEGASVVSHVDDLIELLEPKFAKKSNL